MLSPDLLFIQVCTFCTETSTLKHADHAIVDYFYNSSSNLIENLFSLGGALEHHDLSEIEKSQLESSVFEPSGIDDDFESVDPDGDWVCEDSPPGVWVFHEFDCMEEPLDSCEDEDDYEFSETYSSVYSVAPLTTSTFLLCPGSTDLARPATYPPPGGSGGRFPHGIPPPPPPPPHRRPPHHPHEPHPQMIPSLIYAVNFTLPSLLANHSHFVQIKKYKLTLPIPGPKKPEAYSTKVVVDGQHVALSDLVARNGAVHVIGQLLDPRPHHDHKNDFESGWEDWESWLPQWAADN
jgi:hypothetical protein